jgi:hypothetical protein
MNPLFIVCIILAIVFFILSAVPPTRARYDFIPLGNETIPLLRGFSFGRSCHVTCRIMDPL